MAIYVMPEEFSRIRVLDSKLSDQENLMELSSYDVVLPQPPYRFHRTIHLVSPESLIGVRADLTRLLGCLAKSRSSSGNFALFQTSSFGYINVVFYYDKLFVASAVVIQVETIFEFLYFE
ncbi:hypothetical protein YC2023_105968 [Brassica napus]